MYEKKLVTLIRAGEFTKAAQILKNRQMFPLHINRRIDGFTLLIHAMQHGCADLVRIILNYPDTQVIIDDADVWDMAISRLQFLKVAIELDPSEENKKDYLYTAKIIEMLLSVGVAINSSLRMTDGTVKNNCVLVRRPSAKNPKQFESVFIGLEEILEHRNWLQKNDTGHAQCFTYHMRLRCAEVLSKHDHAEIRALERNLAFGLGEISLKRLCSEVIIADKPLSQLKEDKLLLPSDQIDELKLLHAKLNGVDLYERDALLCDHRLNEIKTQLDARDSIRSSKKHQSSLIVMMLLELGFFIMIGSTLFNIVSRKEISDLAAFLIAGVISISLFLKTDHTSISFIPMLLASTVIKGFGAFEYLGAAFILYYMAHDIIYKNHVKSSIERIKQEDKNGEGFKFMPYFDPIKETPTLRKLTRVYLEHQQNMEAMHPKYRLLRWFQKPTSQEQPQELKSPTDMNLV